MRRNLSWAVPSAVAFLLAASLGGYALVQTSRAPLRASGKADNAVINGSSSDPSARAAAPSASPTPRPAPSSSATAMTSPATSGGASGTAAGGGNPTPRDCTSPVWSSSAAQGTWKSGAFPVNNNAWNTSEAGPQTIYVCNSSSWYVISNQPNLSSDQGSVKTYPSAGEFFSGTQSISSFSNITSTFGVSIPALGEWDAGYDIWTNNWADELMIQNDTHEHPEDPAPAGSVPVTIDGISYHALQVNPKFTVLIMNNYVASGSVSILHVFQWLESKGWMKSSDTLTAIGYGVEISVTENAPGVQGPERLDVTDFSLTAS
jgi:hypothetical protein